MDFDPFNNSLADRENALFADLGDLNAHPGRLSTGWPLEPNPRWRFVNAFHRAHIKALTRPAPILPRLVCFSEPRQPQGIWIEEHFGTFPTTRTFSALEDYCE